jgi:hypothetical protein
MPRYRRFFRSINKLERRISLLKLISILNIKNGGGPGERELARKGSLGVLGMAPGKEYVVLSQARAAVARCKERRLF